MLVDNASNTVPARPGRPVLTIRGREYHATVGVTNEGEIERCYVSRAGSFTSSDDAPAGVRTAVVNCALNAVEAWRKANPAIVARAAYDVARIEHESKARQAEEARQALAEALKVAAAAKRKRERAAKQLAKHEGEGA